MSDEKTNAAAEAAKTGKEFTLTLKDRLVLPPILPAKGNYTELIISQDIKEKVKTTQEELKKYEIVASGMGVKYSEEGAKAEFKISFTDLELAQIKKSLEEMDKAKTLTADHMNLYDVFINAK